MFQNTISEDFGSKTYIIHISKIMSYNIMYINRGVIYYKSQNNGIVFYKYDSILNCGRKKALYN